MAPPNGNDHKNRIQHGYNGLFAVSITLEFTLNSTKAAALTQQQEK